jgi:hypothetical protein
MNLQSKWRVQAGRVMVTGVSDPRVSAQMFGPTGFCPWEEFVQRGIADWRLMNPGDPRCDFHVADSVLEVAFHLKLISKAPDGKFLVPEWIGARSLQGVMDGLLGQRHGELNSTAVLEA